MVKYIITILNRGKMINKLLSFFLATCCVACGSYHAVRPDAPAPILTETQSFSINYKSANGQRIRAVYINSNHPITVELYQGSTVENLKQIQSWTKGVEYSNLSTRWHVQEGFATLLRNNKKTIFTEVAE